MPKVYCSPHRAVLALNPSGPFCCFSTHPEKKGVVFAVQNTQNNDLNATCQKGIFLTRCQESILCAVGIARDI